MIAKLYTLDYLTALEKIYTSKVHASSTVSALEKKRVSIEQHVATTFRSLAMKKIIYSTAFMENLIDTVIAPLNILTTSPA